LMIKLV